MGVNFTQGTEITSSGNAINIPGSIIQIVNTQQTIATTAGTGAWVDLLSASITLTKPGNQILVEYLMNIRNDYSQGSWNLIYTRVLANGSEVMHSGHNGSASLHIGFYERTFLYSPGSAGTYNFVAQGLPYAGTAWLGNYNSGSTNHYLRLYEIGS